VLVDRGGCIKSTHIQRYLPHLVTGAVTTSPAVDFVHTVGCFRASRWFTLESAALPTCFIRAAQIRRCTRNKVRQGSFPLRQVRGVQNAAKNKIPKGDNGMRIDYLALREAWDG
jgi:hypothetical protein